MPCDSGLSLPRHCWLGTSPALLPFSQCPHAVNTHQLADYANDLSLIMDDGSEMAAIVVFKRDGDDVRLFWSSEMNLEMADPGQDPRDAPDIAALLVYPRPHAGRQGPALVSEAELLIPVR